MFIAFDTWGDEGRKKNIFIHSQILENGIYPYFYIESDQIVSQIRKGWKSWFQRKGQNAAFSGTWFLEHH